MKYQSDHTNRAGVEKTSLPLTAEPFGPEIITMGK